MGTFNKREIRYFIKTWENRLSSKYKQMFDDWIIKLDALNFEFEDKIDKHIVTKLQLASYVIMYYKEKLGVNSKEEINIKSEENLEAYLAIAQMEKAINSYGWFSTTLLPYVNERVAYIEEKLKNNRR